MNKKMKLKAIYYFAWILWAITIVGVPIRLLMLWRLTDSPANLWEYGSEIVLSLIAVASATLALLIITRISNNLVGWLLMIPAFTISFPLGFICSVSLRRQPTRPFISISFRCIRSGAGSRLFSQSYLSRYIFQMAGCFRRAGAGWWRLAWLCA